MRRSPVGNCWQHVLAFVGRALGEEGLPAVPASQPSAAWRRVVDPLLPGLSAGAQPDRRLALVVRTPQPDPPYPPAGGVV
jgi:hypothetical protein